MLTYLLRVRSVNSTGIFAGQKIPVKYSIPYLAAAAAGSQGEKVDARASSSLLLSLLFAPIPAARKCPPVRHSQEYWSEHAGCMGTGILREWIRTPATILRNGLHGLCSAHASFCSFQYTRSQRKDYAVDHFFPRLHRFWILSGGQQTKTKDGSRIFCQ